MRAQALWSDRPCRKNPFVSFKSTKNLKWTSRLGEKVKPHPALLASRLQLVCNWSAAGSNLAGPAKCRSGLDVNVEADYSARPANDVRG